jgi:predicted transcriptional regulator
LKHSTDDGPPFSCPVFGAKAEKIISFLGFDIENFPDKALSELKQLPLLQKLEEIEDTDMFLFQKGSGWMERGSKLKTIRLQKISKLEFDDFQKGSSLAEKGVKLLPKRTINILKLLIISLTPMKVEDLMQFMSFGSRDKFREQYLNLLRKEGFIDQTIRDKPNSPDQKYILTEKGKMFLGGFEIE